MPSTGGRPPESANAPVANAGQSAGPSRITPGAEVYSSDDQKVGTVQEVYDDSFMVQKGIFFVHDYYIPYGYVARVSSDRIDLSMTSDVAKNQNWAQRPSGWATGPSAPRPAPGQYGIYGPAGADDTIQAATERDRDLTLGGAGSSPIGATNLGRAAMPVAGLTPEAGMQSPPGTTPATTPSSAPATGGEITRDAQPTPGTGAGATPTSGTGPNSMSTTAEGSPPHPDALSSHGSTASLQPEAQ
jgi:hypothetical protein